MQYENPYGTTGTNVPYVNGNPASGIEGSIIPALAVQNPMTEIVNTISSAGITPIDSDLFQLAKAIQSGALNWAGTFGGTANALTATLSPAPATLIPGMRVAGIAAAANTGPTQLNLNGLGFINVARADGGALVGGELATGKDATFAYDGTVWTLSSSGATIALVNASKTFVSLTGTGTFTVPAGITKITVLCARGGGGGGGGAVAFASPGCAAGGSGGSFAMGEITVTPGAVLAYVVGTGGAGGVPSVSPAVAGSSTTFAGIITAPGGLAGASSTSGSPNPAGPGSPAPASGGAINVVGGTSSSGSIVGSTGIGGTGGGSYGQGACNLPAIGEGAGIPGLFPGIGGNGGGTQSSGSSNNGGGGAAGELILSF